MIMEFKNKDDIYKSDYDKKEKEILLKMYELQEDFNKYSLNKLLEYNQMYYNLLKPYIYENEIIFFIENVVTINDPVIYPIITHDLLNYDVEDVYLNNLIIDISNNNFNDIEILKKCRGIFGSHKYNYDVVYNFEGKRFLKIDFD